MKQKIKNIFNISSKKALGKLGLFLIFGMMIWNLNIYTESLNIKSFFRSEASAAQCTCWNHTGIADYTKVSSPVVDSVEKCASECASTSDGYYKYGAVGNFLPILSNKKSLEEQALNDIKNTSLSALKLLLEGIIYALSELVKFSGSLVDLVITPEFFSSLVANNGIYTGWVIVRDLLNMFFMLLLLFSAFATIFQVEKYHLRKVIIMLIVMALLVNFSFPITRFIIDFSNSAMFFLFEASALYSGSASGIINEIVSMGKGLSDASSGPNNVGSLFLTIILLFIVFCTLISIGLNFLIRIIAFVILIILSPAGFVFAFFPDTKNVSSDWWSALFKYAFLGPIMAFFLYISVLIFKINKKVYYTGLNGDISDAFVTFIVPIVFLWMGLIVSQKFGGTGAGVAMSLAKKTGNSIKSYGQKAAWGVTKAGGRWADDKSGNVISGGLGAAKMKLSQWNDDHKKASNTRATEFADRIGVDGANQKLVQENLKKWKDANGIEDSEEKRIDSEGTKAEKMALALHRAETKGFDKDPIKAAAQYQEALNVLKDNKVYKELFSGNIRKKNIDLEINASVSDEMKKLGRSLLPSETEAIARKSFDKLDPGDWKEQNIERTIALNKMYGNDGVKDAAKRRISSYKSPNKATENMRGVKYDAGVADGWW